MQALWAAMRWLRIITYPASNSKALDPFNRALRVGAKDRYDAVDVWLLPFPWLLGARLGGGSVRGVTA
jgi:hypothetical protein